LEPEAEKIRAALDLKQGDVQGVDLQAQREAVAAAPHDPGARLALAKTLAAAEQFEESLQLALGVVQDDRHGAGEDARKLMVDVFRLLPDDSEMASNYRRKLSAALY
jgi:putative thioredoxin